MLWKGDQWHKRSQKEPKRAEELEERWRRTVLFVLTELQFELHNAKAY